MGSLNKRQVQSVYTDMYTTIKGTKCVKQECRYMQVLLWMPGPGHLQAVVQAAPHAYTGIAGFLQSGVCVLSWAYPALVSLVWKTISVAILPNVFL